jgi:hypothetical protein
MNSATDWGWYRFFHSGFGDSETVDYTLYSGATECDTSRGRVDGTLHVSRIDDTLYFEFESNGSVVTELDIWVGVTPLPLTRDGFSNDPESFLCTYKGSSIDSVDCTADLSMDESFYLSIHATTVGDCL